MKLRNFLLALITAAPMFARAASGDGIYLDGSLGSGSNYDKYDATDLPRSTVADVNVGYHWSWFGVEAGYLKASTEQAIVSFEPIPLKTTKAERGETVGVSGHWNFDSNWYLSARAGAFFRHYSYRLVDLSSQTHYAHVSDNGTSWYAGVGAGYDFTPHFGLGVRYDFYDAHDHALKVPSLNAEVRF